MQDPRIDARIEVDVSGFELPVPVAPPAFPVKSTAPKPPPAGLDPGKWADLDRATRRALIRHHRKVTGER